MTPSCSRYHGSSSHTRHATHSRLFGHTLTDKLAPMFVSCQFAGLLAKPSHRLPAQDDWPLKTDIHAQPSSTKCNQIPKQISPKPIGCIFWSNSLCRSGRRLAKQHARCHQGACLPACLLLLLHWTLLLLLQAIHRRLRTSECRHVHRMHQAST
jgi:hypothetical protein